MFDYKEIAEHLARDCARLANQGDDQPAQKIRRFCLTYDRGVGRVIPDRVRKVAETIAAFHSGIQPDPSKKFGAKHWPAIAEYQSFVSLLVSYANGDTTDEVNQILLSIGADAEIEEVAA